MEPLKELRMKVNVKYIENNQELEFIRLDDGRVMNFGRSLPF